MTKEPPKMLSAAEFFALFERPATHEFMQRVLRHYGNAEGLVVYENLAMDSSSFGERSALVVGPFNTVRSVEEAFAGPPIGDVPSRFKYPVAWCSREALLAHAVHAVPPTPPSRRKGRS